MYEYNLGFKFADVVLRCTENVAVRTIDDALTYKQLNNLSNSFARYLLSQNLNIGDVICIAGEKTFSSVALVIAALKTGIVYSFFDPESPVERLTKIFDQCRPKKVFCSSQLISKMQDCKTVQAIDYSCLQLNTPTQSEDNLLKERTKKVTSEDAAYIMFTSGSTGIPKGAVMTQQNVINLIHWSQGTYHFTEADVLTSVNPFYFDNSVFDLYSSVFSGASIMLLDAETVRNPRLLLELLDKHHCTSWFSVPSMLIYLQTVRALTDDKLPHLKRIIFGGEGYPKAKLKNLFEMYSPRITFYNVYGPTECTCICSSYEVSASDFSDVQGFLPLGELAPNFDYIIVDDNLKEVSPGITGELLLRGPNVGLGYYADVERTKISFVQNPRHDRFREIVYRTGDLVSLNRDDNKLYISGRRDNQIKHMGYRIELEEIENALSCIKSFTESVVIHCEHRGVSQLVAFVSTEEGQLDERSARAVLSQIIPPYMIPTKFQSLSSLPKNQNGKLDRKQLKLDYLGQLNG